MARNVICLWYDGTEIDIAAIEAARRGPGRR